MNVTSGPSEYGSMWTLSKQGRESFNLVQFIRLSDSYWTLSQPQHTFHSHTHMQAPFKFPKQTNAQVCGLWKENNTSMALEETGPSWN